MGIRYLFYVRIREVSEILVVIGWYIVRFICDFDGFRLKVVFCLFLMFDLPYFAP